MTIEEKAKAYDETLDRAKNFIENGDKGEKTVAESIFAGFINNESEDKKIRKEINILYSEIDNCISELLKARTDKNSEAEGKALFKMEGLMVGTLQDLSYIEDYIEEQKEKKPVEWSDEYREEDLRTRFAFYTYKDEDNVLYLSNVFVEETSRNKGFGTKILAAAEKVAETIGATQIRLKVKQDSPANIWYCKHGYGYIAFENGYDWLEKTLEYMKPTKLAEWSEEDSRILYNVIAYVGYAAGQRGVRDDEFREANSWLKSLRPSKDCSDCAKHLEGYISGRCDAENKLLEQLGALITPEGELHIKPRWKPSKEQMEALDSAINYLTEHTCTSGNSLLISLSTDLQKLL